MGCCLFFYYTCAKESPATRALIIWFYILSGITVVLVFAWTCIYFGTMYENDSIMKRILFEDEDSKRAYEKENKGWFYFMLVLTFLIEILYVALYWYITHDWVEKHKN